MKQEIIDKILRCRAIIDKHRTWYKTEFVEAEADIVSAVAALSVKSEQNIKYVKEALKVPEEDRTVSVNEMNSILQAEGFSDIAIYQKWDREMCFEAYVEIAAPLGECDMCKGYEGTPPCFAKFGEKSCFAKQEQLTQEDLLKIAFTNFMKRGDGTKGMPSVTDGGCPEGHGYYKGERKGDFPFPMFWRAI